jgi:hypothetical protein
MRKLSVALVVVLACLSCLAVASASAKSVPAKLTIRSYPSGAFGYVESASKGCADQRKVEVFEQDGKRRDPANDRRAGSDRAEASEDSYLWTVKTKRSGRFYARAAAKPGCAAALSGTVRSLTVNQGIGADNPDAPVCSPYTSEGTSEICRFTELYLDLEQEGAFNPCRFGSGSGGCPGLATGAFPWGQGGGGGRVKAQINWSWNGKSRNIQVVSYPGERSGAAWAHLGGTVPNAGSDRFTVTDAFAQNDRGYPNGDHFFTPDLPGQRPGEIGGPLGINFQNGSGTNFGAECWISGYLYLKH